VARGSGQGVAPHGGIHERLDGDAARRIADMAGAITATVDVQAG
jgi:hypothetical protein